MSKVRKKPDHKEVNDNVFGAYSKDIYMSSQLYFVISDKTLCIKHAMIKSIVYNKYRLNFNMKKIT